MNGPWRTIGIIGGLGPLASAHFYLRLVTLTRAESDQSHPEVIVISDPSIPSRLDHLSGSGASPVPRLQEVATRLEGSGAEIIVVPSITTNAYCKEISSAVKVPVLDMPAIIAEELSGLGIRRIRVAATDAARRVGLLEQRLLEAGIDPVYPDDDAQAKITQVVALVKSGLPDAARETFATLLQKERAGSADAILVGCTDLSPVAPHDIPGLHDVTDLLAAGVLARAAAR